MTRILKAVSAISSATLVSRVLGFVRDITQAHVLGASWLNGVFLIAWMLPNLMRRLLGEGALSAAFIPAFTRTMHKDGDGAAKRLLASVSGVLLVASGALALAVVTLSLVVPPTWLQLEDSQQATGVQRGAALLHLTSILFPYVVPICLGAILTGALNALGVFGWPALAPALVNVFWLAALLCIHLLSITEPSTIATILAVALLISGIGQLIPAVVQLAQRKMMPVPTWPPPGDPARSVFLATLPTMFGMSMTQFSMLIDQFFAEWFCGAGMTTHLYYSNRLLLFPHALTSLALGQAVFPRFSQLASREETKSLDAEVWRAMHWTFLITVPASAGLILVSPQLIDVFFVHGKFTKGDAYWTVRTTATLVAGLPFIGMAQLHARALYALGDMKAPAYVAAFLLAIGILLNAVLVLGLGLNVAGLTIATSLCAMLNALLLRRRFIRLCGAGHTRATSIVPAVRILGAAALMTAAVFCTSWVASTIPLADHKLAHTALRALLEVALPVGVGVVTFCAAHLALGGQEMRSLRSLLRRA